MNIIKKIEKALEKNGEVLLACCDAKYKTNKKYLTVTAINKNYALVIDAHGMHTFFQKEELEHFEISSSLAEVKIDGKSFTVTRQKADEMLEAVCQ